MFGRVVLHLVLLGVLGSGCGLSVGEGSSTSRTIFECPVTMGGEAAFVPPDPYAPRPPEGYEGMSWYGTENLWTMLPRDGLWMDLPRGDRGYTQKTFWWSAAYEAGTEPIPDIQVSGRRLDGDAAAFETSDATHAMADFGEAMLVGVEMPTDGCWEITARYRGTELGYTIMVRP